MTPDDLAHAADQLAPCPPANGLPPMPTGQILDSITEDVRIVLADLWTLRDSIDATGTDADQVADLARLAGHLADSLDTGRRMAARAGHLIPMDRTTADPW